MNQQIGNQAIGRLMTQYESPIRRAVADKYKPLKDSPSLVVQRALAAQKIAAPALEVDLNTILTKAVNKPTLPKKKAGSPMSHKKNIYYAQVMTTLFGDDQSKWDETSDKFLKTGDIFGDCPRDNAGCLPGKDHKEYDQKLYTRGKNRGDKRIVTAVDGDKTRYFYTADHYTNFAEFDKA